MAMRSSPVLDIRQQQQQQPYPQLNLAAPQQQQQQQQQDSLAGRSVPLDTQPYTSAPPTRKQNTACDPCRSASHTLPAALHRSPHFSLPSLKEPQGSLQSCPRFRQGTIFHHLSTFPLIDHQYSLSRGCCTVAAAVPCQLGRIVPDTFSHSHTFNSIANPRVMIARKYPSSLLLPLTSYFSAATMSSKPPRKSDAQPLPEIVG